MYRSLSCICPVLIATAITVAGCAGHSRRQETHLSIRTLSGDTVTIRKDGDACVLEAREAGTGAKAVIVSRPDGTATITGTSEGGKAVIKAGPDGKATLSVNGGPAVQLGE